jgi:hypothetical protein
MFLTQAEICSYNVKQGNLFYNIRTVLDWIAIVFLSRTTLKAKRFNLFENELNTNNVAVGWPNF